MRSGSHNMKKATQPNAISFQPNLMKHSSPILNRRQFLRSTTALGMAAYAHQLLPVFAQNAVERPVLKPDSTGAIDLVIDETEIVIGGKSALATTLNGTVPGPLVRLQEGTEAVIRVTNRLKGDSSIHWHGVILPYQMDGVPGLSYDGIQPGETFEYRFPVTQNGTYWYHSHTGLQEQTGLYGPMIIEAARREPWAYDREYVVMLSDWTFDDPHTLLAKLKKQADYSNYQQRTLLEFIRDTRRDGFMPTMKERLMWSKMRMMPTDFADITGHYYTYLMNGRDPDSNWTGLFKPGEKVRLRFINAAAGTYFDVRIPGLPLTVVQADGQNVAPVQVDEFRIAVAETYDVIVEPKADHAYTIFAESMDRSGYARGTLAPRAGLSAAIPPRRERPTLTMKDMGMDMGDMKGMSGMDGMKGMDSSESTTNAIAIATVAFPALLTICYYALWHASASMATPGKMAAGLVVVNASAQRISVPQAFVREFVKLIGTWFFLLTYATQPISARRQAIHDFVGGTVVLRQRPDAGMPSVVVWLINLCWGAALLMFIAIIVAFQ